MSYPNPLNLPEEVVAVVHSFHTVEYASLTKAGLPITFPISPYVGEDGCTLDMQTGLAYTAKAQRARNQPKVGLLYSEPLGSGLHNPPVVLVYGQATVRDADLQANTDRYVRLTLERYPNAYGRFPTFFLSKMMGWYFPRIWIEVTPMRVLWWPGGDLSRAPEMWRAPTGSEAPLSDPPPRGKGLKRWDRPPAEWRSGAEYAVVSLGKPVLTVVDDQGYPVPFRSRNVSLDSRGFRLELWSTRPAPARGKACLTFHRHDAGMSLQENMVFVGQVWDEEGLTRFDVERRVTSVSFGEGSMLWSMLYFLNLRRQLAPRVKREAARRNQPVPKVRVT